MLFFLRDTWRTPVQEALVMLVWKPFCACVMVAALFAALCSPRSWFAATPAATAVCCDLWRPCPCLSGLATRLGCLGFAAMMAATCRDWWRPCPCLRGSATPCFGFWRGSLRSEAALLGLGRRENIRLLTGCFAGLGHAEFGRVRGRGAAYSLPG